jgi:hypothetical protein
MVTLKAYASMYTSGQTQRWEELFAAWILRGLIARSFDLSRLDRERRLRIGIDIPL